MLLKNDVCVNDIMAVMSSKQIQVGIYKMHDSGV